MATTNETPTFAQAGAVFNDATRLLEGGLWQNIVEEGGQGLGSAGPSRHRSANGSGRAAGADRGGQFNGATLTSAKIVANLDQEIAAATAAVNGGGSFGSVAAAEAALRNLHLGVLTRCRAIATLAALATADGATGFQPVPPSVRGRRYRAKRSPRKSGRNRRDLRRCRKPYARRHQ